MPSTTRKIIKDLIHIYNRINSIYYRKVNQYMASGYGMVKAKEIVNEDLTGKLFYHLNKIYKLINK